MNKIYPVDLEIILGFSLPDHVYTMLENFNLEYEDLSKEETDQVIIKILKTLDQPPVAAGEHRSDQWDDGWRENLENYKQSHIAADLIPKYHGKYNVYRWNGRFIKSKIPQFDYKIHICFVDAILNYYLKKCENIYEFGCGPAYHLLRFNERNPKTKLCGCDWAPSSQNIIKELNRPNLIGQNFNFYEPFLNEPNYKFERHTGIYTVAALEQVGDKFKKFVDYLIYTKPDVCVHMEPVDELLNPNNLLDYLSIQYFRKRNYLNKFLPYLESLEKEGKIQIIEQTRIFSGSLCIEGHSLIVWKVK